MKNIKANKAKWCVRIICIILLSLSVVGIINAEDIASRHVPQEPYIMHQIRDTVTGDTITYYLSEFARDEVQPLIVYIQGSGNSSLFNKDSTGKIIPVSGHISWTYAAQNKAKVLISEKPGVKFLDNAGDNPNFDKKFSLDSWSREIETVIRYVMKTEMVGKIMIAGHSEGGLVAAKVARDMDGLFTNVTILAGEGPSQLYSLYKFAEHNQVYGCDDKSPLESALYLTQIWKLILSDPHATDKKFWGFTYLRWSSFLKTSVLEELSGCTGRVLIIQGDADKNVYPESAKFLYTGLLSKGVDAQLQIIPNADHSFNIAGKPEINGWEMVVKKSIEWFLTPPGNRIHD